MYIKSLYFPLPRLVGENRAFTPNLRGNAICNNSRLYLNVEAIFDKVAQRETRRH